MARLVVLFGKGGLSDVGRHVVQAALERSQVTNIQVFTEYPEMLEESKWNCGCHPETHSFSDLDRERFQVVPIKSWKTAAIMNDDDKELINSLSSCFEGATAVISCVGNRQPFIGGWNAHAASQVVVKAMNKASSSNQVSSKRVVSISSAGVQDDWPPIESFKPGMYILSFMFVMPGLVRSAYQDLTAMEQEYQKSDLDYLLVRPYGLGEDVRPMNKWWIQKKKYEDVVGVNIAKLDCARFMVQEALHPTLHKEAVVIGGDPDASIN